METINDWNNKMEEWINRLMEIEHYMDKIKKGHKINADLKNNLWEKFYKILKEYSNYMVLWDNVEYEEMVRMDKLINVIYRDLLKYVK